MDVGTGVAIGLGVSSVGSVALVALGMRGKADADYVEILKNRVRDAEHRLDDCEEARDEVKAKLRAAGL